MDFEGDNGSDTFGGVIGGEVAIFFFEEIHLPRIAVDDTGEGLTESRDVSSTIRLMDIVAVSEGVGMETGVVLEADFEFHVFTDAVEVDGFVDDGLGVVDIFNQLNDSPFEEVLFHWLFTLFNGEGEADAGVEVGEFFESSPDDGRFVFGDGEGGWVGHPVLFGSGFFGFTDDFNFGDWNSGFETLLKDFAFLLDGGDHPLGKGVGTGDTDTVETAGDFVSSAVTEFSSGVEFGHDDGEGGDAFFFVNSRWDPASVVFD